MSIDWDAVSAVTGLIGLFFVAISVAVLVLQIRELQRTTAASAYAAALAFFQTEEMRLTRRRVYTLDGKPLTQWSDSEVSDVSRACQAFDCVGVMVTNGMLPMEIIAGNWRHAIKETWRIAKPLTERRREERGADYWDDFEELARAASNS